MSNKFKRSRPLPVPEEGPKVTEGHNKFKAIRAPNIPPVEVHEAHIMDLSLGVMRDRSPRTIPPGASPEMGNVKFEGGALRKDFGSTAIGTAAATKILAIGEHKFIDAGLTYHRLIRLRDAGGLSAGKLAIDIWDGTSWVQEAISSEPLNVGYLSVASTQGRFLAADGNQILTWYELPVVEARSDEFTAGNSLTKVGQTVDAVIDPAGAEENKYDIRYHVDMVISEGSGYVLTVALLHNGVEVDTKKFELSSGSKFWDDQLFELTRAVALNDTLTLKVKSLTASDAGRPKHFAIWRETGTKDLEATKPTSASPPDGIYTYRYKVTHGGDDFTVRFYYRAAPADAWIEKSFFIHTQYDEGLNEFGFALGDLPDTAEFAVDVTSGDWGAGAATGGISPPPNGEGVVYNAIEFGDDITIDVHGYNQPTDGDVYPGVSYEVEVPPAAAFEKLSPDAPAARFVLPFGDRLLAFRDGGDSQSVAWSADGDISNWDIYSTSAGQTYLLDTRSDGVDAIQGAAVLTSSVVAVFRQRSIMRGQETGNFQMGMGFFHWIENLGTESPFSIQATPHGIMFLGHDMQVYLLTQQGPRAVGMHIHRALLETLTSNLELVDSAYDPTFNEYLLAVPENGATRISGVWILDIGRMVEKQEISWRYRKQEIQRLATVSVVE